MKFCWNLSNLIFRPFWIISDLLLSLCYVVSGEGLIFAHSRLFVGFSIDSLFFSFLAEAIKLDVELKNPLHTTISVSGISLICDFCVGSETTEFGMELSCVCVCKSFHISLLSQ